MGRALVLLAIAVTAPGCFPTCDNSCIKLKNCDLVTTGTSPDECEATCLSQQRMYDRWEDEEKQDAFKDHKLCLLSSTCDEIAAGDCYDPLLVVWKDADK